MLRSPKTGHPKFAQPMCADVEAFKLQLQEYIRDHIMEIVRTDRSRETASAILRQDVASSIVNNIEMWLFDAEPESSLLQLQELDGPQQRCGKVFKPGEKIYSCRECATCPFSVFCEPCFEKSTHKEHRFTFAVHASDGMCDCGDVEAWHRDHTCRIHMSQQDHRSGENTESRLLSVVHKRAPYFIRALLLYIVEILTKKHTSLVDMASSLQPREKEDTFVTVLFGDEQHDPKYITDILKKAIDCNDSDAEALANALERQGRIVVCVSDEEECENVKRFMVLAKKSLRIQVIHTSIFAYQEMAVLLLESLTRMVQKSQVLRKIFCKIAMKESADFHPEVYSRRSLFRRGSSVRCPVECLMRCHHELWKTACDQHLSLLKNSLLQDPKTKRLFAVLFTRLYALMQDGFLKGSHKYSESVLSLAVQFYTVPSLVQYLIVSEDVISVILRALAKSCLGVTLDLKNWCSVLNISTTGKLSSDRIYCMFEHLSYILANAPDKCTIELEPKFVEGMKLFLQVLMAFEGSHETLFVGETSVASVLLMHTQMHYMLQCLSTHVDLLCTALDLCLHASHALSARAHSFIDDDTSKPFVSTLHPVSQFTAGILVELGKHGVTWSDIEKNPHVTELLEPSIMTWFMECALHCLCPHTLRTNSEMSAEGFLSNDCERCPFEQEGFERHVQLLQICASKMGPNNFIKLLMEKTGNKPEQQNFAEWPVSMLSEFFGLLISVARERFIPGIGDITLEEQIKRQIILILALGPKTFKEIRKKLPEWANADLVWEKLLEDIADLEDDGFTKRYVLKRISVMELCPYSFNDVRAKQGVGVEKILKKIRDMKMKEGERPADFVFVPSSLPRFSNLLSNVSDVLCCDAFFQFLSAFLQQLSRNSNWSSQLVQKALYLIGVALVENEQQLEANPDTKFDFAKKARSDSIPGCENSILFLLKQLLDSGPLTDHRETIRWLMTKIEWVGKCHRISKHVGHKGDGVKLPGVKINVPMGAVEVEKVSFSTATVTKCENDSFDVAPRVQANTQAKFSKPVTVKVRTCFSARRGKSVPISLWHRYHADDDWEEIKHLSIAERNKIKYTLESGGETKLTVKEEALLRAGLKVNFHAIEDFCINSSTAKMLTVFCKDKNIHEKTMAELHDKDYTHLSVMSHKLAAPWAAKVETKLTCKTPEQSEVAKILPSLNFRLDEAFLVEGAHITYFELCPQPSEQCKEIEILYECSINNKPDHCLPLKSKWPPEPRRRDTTVNVNAPVGQVAAGSITNLGDVHNHATNLKQSDH